MDHPIPEDDAPPGFAPAVHGGPYARALGPFHRKVEHGRLTLGLRLRHHHCNSSGHAHGGLVASLADLGLIHAVSVLQAHLGRPRTHLTTASLTVDFTGPAPEGSWLEIRCEVSKLGRSLGFVEGALHASDKRVGRASAIIAVLGPRQD